MKVLLVPAAGGKQLWDQKDCHGLYFTSKNDAVLAVVSRSLMSSGLLQFIKLMRSRENIKAGQVR